MFTRNSIVLSNSIKTPLTAISKAIGSNGILKYSYNFDEIIRQIFSHQEQGFAYDPNDLTTLYQDAAGTTPVTAAGQPVGLMLDKSKGLVLSSELVKNGDFSDGSTDWNLHATWVLSNNAIIATNAPSGTGPYQYLTTTLGRFYKITFTVSNYIAGSVFPTLFNGDNGAAVSSNGTFSSIIFKRNTGVSAIGVAALHSFSGTIDNISVKEIAGNPAYQTTSASRPILRQNAVTGAYYLEFDGSDDFLQTNNINFTATDKVSLFAGVRKLNDAAGMVAELSTDTNLNPSSFYIIAGNDVGEIGYTSFSKGMADGNLSQLARNFTYLAPDTAVLSAKHDISGDLSSMRRNGVVGIDGTGDKGSGNFGNYPLYIGRRGGASIPFNGHIYNLIGIGRLTTDSETVALEKSIAKNTGVTLNV